MFSVHLFTIISIFFFHLISSNVIHDVEKSDAVRAKSNILMAHAIIRHGERNQKYLCPNDPLTNSKHRPADSQLTNLGKLQAFESGQWLAKRYQPLFPNGYSAKTVKVHSSEYDHTMMSAAACLAGMFPPTEQQMWNSNLQWQPIPIFASNSDGRFPNVAKCTLKEKLHDEFINSLEIRRMLGNYQKAFDYAKFYCGNLTIDVFKQIYWTYDSLRVQVSRNETISTEASEVYDDLQSLFVFNYKSFSTTPQIIRLNSFLLKEVFEDFKNKSERNKKYNFILYSGHKSTFISMLISLGIFDNKDVPYGACIIFELYQEDDQFYVQIVYKKEEDFTVMNIPNCGTKCPLAEIIEKYRTTLPEYDFEIECRNRESL